MTDKTAKMLERVRALLAKADSTPFSGEADVFRAKADELMTAYAIEQWMVDAARPDERAKPEIRKFDFTWWRRSQHAQKLWYLYASVAQHCRCVIAQRGYDYTGQMPVIGLSSDLDYFDMLFTHLMLQMGKQLEPDVDTSLSPGHNVFRLRQAGLPWPRITEKMFKAGQIAATAAQCAKFGIAQTTDPWTNYPDALRHELKNKLANWNRAFVKENGLQGERNYVRPAIYQDGFSEGFVTEVGARLQEMRADQTSAYDANHSGDSMALVVRDIYDQALALYNEKWPPPPPVKVDPNAKVRVSKAVGRERAFSWEAYNAGKKAGAEADLANKPGGRIGGRGEIER